MHICTMYVIWLGGRNGERNGRGRKKWNDGERASQAPRQPLCRVSLEICEMQSTSWANALVFEGKCDHGGYRRGFVVFQFSTQIHFIGRGFEVFQLHGRIFFCIASMSLSTAARPLLNACRCPFLRWREWHGCTWVCRKCGRALCRQNWMRLIHTNSI